MTMAELPERRSTRVRKPIIRFADQIVQSAELSEAPEASIVTTKPPAKLQATAKPTKAPTTKAPAKAPTKAKVPAKVPAKAKAPAPTTDIEQLCDQIEGLNFEEEDDAIEPNDASDKKGKKKAKAEEIARLSKLSFIDIMKEAKDPKDVLFEPFVPGHSREPEVNIPPNIDTSSPLALFELFIYI